MSVWCREDHLLYAFQFAFQLFLNISVAINFIKLIKIQFFHCTLVKQGSDKLPIIQLSKQTLCVSIKM